MRQIVIEIKKALELAIDNIIAEGITDVELFSRPFEIDMLKQKEFRDEVIKKISSRLKGKDFSQLKVTPISYSLIPKKDFFDFRKCSLIEPLDEIEYLTIVIMIADEIEHARVPRSKNYIFSYRWKPIAGFLFDPKYNYTSFRNFVKEKSKKRNVNVIAECDIANFYDRINLHRLECILSSIKSIDEKNIKTIDLLLKFWANRDSYGLPVGSNASRILAEAALIEVDKYLLSQKISFCRFVDDYRFFAPDAATAHYWLSLFVARLSKEGLFINANKTRLKDVSSDGENGIYAVDEATDEASSTHEEGKQKGIAKIIRGYSGLIPLKFRKLRKNEIENLRKNNLQNLFPEIHDTTLIDPKKLVEFAKTCIAQGNASYIVKTILIIHNFPQFIPFMLDLIQKNDHLFSDANIQEITIYLNTKWLDSPSCPEYILVYIIKLFGTSRFANKEILFSFFRNLRRNQGNYIGRAILEQLESFVAQ